MNITKNTLITTFAVSIVVANITGTKLAHFNILGGITVPAGFVAFGVAFLCSDLISELYGKDIAHAVVNGTIGALIVGWILVYISLLLPSAPFYDDTAYTTVLGSSATIVMAGVLSMLFSQNIDVNIFHNIRNCTGKQWLFARNVGSTVVSQFIDTALFIGLAFVVLPTFIGGASQPLTVAIQLFFGQYIMKIFVALLDTPVFYAVTLLSNNTTKIEQTERS